MCACPLIVEKWAICTRLKLCTALVKCIQVLHLCQPPSNALSCLSSESFIYFNSCSSRFEEECINTVEEGEYLCVCICTQLCSCV